MKKLIQTLFVIIFTLSLVLPNLNAVASEDTTLRVALMTEQDKVATALEMRAKELGITLDIEYYETADLYREGVNSQILAGKAPDILYANAIPYWDYAKTGLLAEVGAMIEKTDYKDDLCENIVDGLRDASGNLYVLPCSYRIMAYMLNKELAAEYGMEIPESLSFGDIIALCAEFTEKAKDNPTIHPFLGGDSYMRDIVLREILVNIDFNTGKSNIEAMDNRLLEYITDISKMPSYAMYEPEKFFCVIAWLANSNYTPQVTGRMVLEKSQVGAVPRTDTNNGVIYELDEAFCITKGKNAELAFELLGGLMSESSQTAPGGIHSNPIRESATDKRFETVLRNMESQIIALENGEDMSMFFGEMETREEVTSAFLSYVDNYKAMINKLEVPLMNDPILTQNIMSVIQNANAESISSGDAKTEISRVVDVYLSETGGDISQGYTIIYIAGGVAVGAVAAFVVIRALKKRRQ